MEITAAGNKITCDEEVEYWRYLREHIGHNQIILPGAFAIIKNNGKILLVKDSNTGQWTLAGGLQNLNESILDTLGRELNEELGVELKLSDNPKLIAVLTSPKWITKLKSGDIFQPHAHLYEVNINISETNTIRTNELIDMRFFETDNLPLDINSAALKMIKIYTCFTGEVYVD